ncbi:hypothetical protein NPIL_426301 [Nephila pilipes]|uniref:Uncharacterized protein n=1 Tax=Nephila pilipes TaxID=299642 RepID=A0A8X6NEU6_NEPPI|nr:hypothetical protein NPIL_426301 [Nephila pilipes]
MSDKGTLCVLSSVHRLVWLQTVSLKVSAREVLSMVSQSVLPIVGPARPLRKSVSGLGTMSVDQPEQEMEGRAEDGESLFWANQHSARNRSVNCVLVLKRRQCSSTMYCRKILMSCTAGVAL